MRKLIVVALVVAALAVSVAACGAYRFPSGPAAQTGTVTGQVIAIPCAPVENPETQCKGRPVPGLELVFAGAAGAVATARTDDSGSYAVQLAAGTWTVSMKGYLRIISGPQQVTVRAGETTVADYVVDSGIRLPATSPVD
jgi:hypothetical protein